MPWRISPGCWTPPTPTLAARDMSWCGASYTPRRTLWKSPIRGFTFTPPYLRRSYYRRNDKMAEEGLLVQSKHLLAININPGSAEPAWAGLAMERNSFQPSTNEAVDQTNYQDGDG